jgi:UDP-N-acetylglucosamine 2-epimerase (non-hydrolysing)
MAITPPDSNVIPMRPAPPALLHTTVVHAVADHDQLVDVAPVIAALERRGGFRQVVVHAGTASQGTPATDEMTCVHRWLGMDGETPATRTAAMLTAFEAVLFEEQPELVVVSGDDDAALAAALAAAKLTIAVAHLGSGMRSWDWTRPEEINRSVIDRLSDTLFTSFAEASENLAHEGIPAERVHAVGSTRVDFLRRCQARARSRAVWREYGVEEGHYTLVALRRGDLLRAPGRLDQLTAALGDLARNCDVLLLSHEGTRETLASERATALLSAAGVRCVDAASYADALSLAAGAGAVVTDTCSVQEEATALGVRCYTLLNATPITVTLTHGTNVLLGEDPAELRAALPTCADPTPAAIPLWDGRAAERVADILVANFTLSTVERQTP